MLTFRIDDVGANTDLKALKSMVKFLKKEFVCEVWLCVSLFSKEAVEGSVYPKPPFKDRERNFFYETDKFFDHLKVDIPDARLVSHGLFHIDHSALQFDAQQMSIAGSCNFIGTSIFVPPFNRYNESTESVCRQNLITLIKTDRQGWKCLEREEFNLKDKLWYFHPWRFTLDSFKQKVLSCV